MPPSIFSVRLEQQWLLKILHVREAETDEILRIVSGGFAVVQPDSQLSVNAVEGFPLEDFSADVCCVCVFNATN